MIRLKTLVNEVYRPNSDFVTGIVGFDKSGRSNEIELRTGHPNSYAFYTLPPNMATITSKEKHIHYAIVRDNPRVFYNAYGHLSEKFKYFKDRSGFDFGGAEYEKLILTILDKIEKNQIKSQKDKDLAEGLLEDLQDVATDQKKYPFGRYWTHVDIFDCKDCNVITFWLYPQDKWELKMIVKRLGLQVDKTFVYGYNSSYFIPIEDYERPEQIYRKPIEHELPPHMR